MSDSFWIFLSVVVFMGMLLPIIAIVTKHKHTMKRVEIEAMKIPKANLQPDVVEAAK
jgi:hypothetical protein